mmetsp:Transcript_2489/g.5528  ORF Transcript_2489/g.5528 Transcript_2489/m.5528 type:complete len:353 (+) Transcript_2489:241-1299(+)
MQNASDYASNRRSKAILAFASLLSLLSSTSAFSVTPRHPIALRFSHATRSTNSVLVGPTDSRGKGFRLGRIGGLKMEILGPIGPLAPYRSQYIQSGQLQSESGQMTALVEEVAKKFQALGVGMQSGMPPDPATCARVAGEMEELNDKWKVMLARWRLADDFQARELFQLTQARSEQSGLTLEEMQTGVQWQIDFLRAMSENRMPPEMPAALTKAFEGQQQQQGGMGSPESFNTFFSGPPELPILPSSKALDSPVVAEELNSIMKQHEQMVKMGEGYGKWDREGKKMYIQQLGSVEERWATFLKRFELMGEVNPEYQQSTDAFLKSYQMSSVEEFKNWLKTTRDKMLSDAEAS